MAVAGIELWLIQAFCRWGSRAVFEYVRDCQVASATDMAVRVARGLQLTEVRERGNLTTRRLRPQSSLGFGETFIKQLKADDKATLNFPVNIKARVLVSRNTEERVFVVDSGASMHMLSKKDFRSDELDTFEKIQRPCDGGDRQWGSANKRGSTSVRS